MSGNDFSFNLFNGIESANDVDFAPKSQIANLHFILRHISFNKCAKNYESDFLLFIFLNKLI